MVSELFKILDDLLTNRPAAHVRFNPESNEGEVTCLTNCYRYFLQKQLIFNKDTLEQIKMSFFTTRNIAGKYAKMDLKFSQNRL